MACRTGSNAFVQHALRGRFAELPPLSMWRRYSEFPVDIGAAQPTAPSPLPTGQVDFAGDAPVLRRTAPAEFHESTHAGCTGGRHLVALEVCRRTVPHLVLKCEPRIQCRGGVAARVAGPCTQTMRVRRVEVVRPKPKGRAPTMPKQRKERLQDMSQDETAQ